MLQRVFGILCFYAKDAPQANKTEVKYFGSNLELIDGYINDAGKRSLEQSSNLNLLTFQH